MSAPVPTPWTLNFPPCPQWVPEDARMRNLQARKVAEEVVEALHAVDQWGGENVDGYIMELMDVVHAAETALREFPEDVLDAAKASAIEKNGRRGYYGERKEDIDADQP